MKKLLINLLSIYLIISCNNTENNLNVTIKTKDSEKTHINNAQDQQKAEITNTLYLQKKYWNNGDIDGFMQGYWNSEDLIFTSAKHKPAYGWKNTLERYKESYPDIYSMGELKFDIVEVELISDTTSKIYGGWELIRMNDHPIGEFWLDLRKFNNIWLITKDSTISY